jgi:hypothetical protein
MRQPESVVDFKARLALLMRQRETGIQYTVLGAKPSDKCVTREQPRRVPEQSSDNMSPMAHPKPERYGEASKNQQNQQKGQKPMKTRKMTEDGATVLMPLIKASLPPRRWRIMEDDGYIVILPADADPDDVAFGRVDCCKVSDMLPAYTLVQEVVNFFNLQEVSRK